MNFMKNNDEIKICIKCSREKITILFVKNGNICKECKNFYNRKYNKAHKEEIKKYKQMVYEANKKEILADRKIYYEKNRDNIKFNVRMYRSNNKESLKKTRQIYYKLNKNEIDRKNLIYNKNKMKTDPVFKMRKNISRMINIALKSRGGSKYGQSVLDYLPYPIEELKNHLEKQFEFWMTWENHGTYLKDKHIENDPFTWTWHIDHIIPQSKLPFQSMDEENFQKCWALENLRPLKSIDNIVKGNK